MKSRENENILLLIYIYIYLETTLFKQLIYQLHLHFSYHLITLPFLHIACNLNHQQAGLPCRFRPIRPSSFPNGRDHTAITTSRVIGSRLCCFSGFHRCLFCHLLQFRFLYLFFFFFCVYDFNPLVFLVSSIEKREQPRIFIER